MAPYVRVCVPGGSDIAVWWEPAHQTTLKGGTTDMAKKAAKGGKKKGGKKR
jgi:hypothetical protein